VNTFDEDYEEESTVVLSPAERSRVQMIYIPASRDGARQVTAFLRSRLWRAAQWSAELRDLTHEQAIVLADRFAREPVVDAVEKALASRWDELHHGGTNTDPRFRLLDSDFTQLVRNSELVFDPDYSGRSRPAHLLSDGQRSLLHLALTAATLDVEAAVNGGHHDAEFTLDPARLPSLTVVAVEEPENSLSPFYLSRIVNQLLGLAEKAATQSLLSSHSASVLPRVAPERIRYFRLDAQAVTSTVQEVLLPPNDTEAGTYVREAVRAHPELYFAKFVILGEGDTEELVIPRIAQARGVQLDPSFVAVVPLGGRHTNHMWTLLEDLGIPHATLLDLDYGKPGAGPARLRDACGRLENIGLKPLEELEGFEQVSDLRDGLALGELGRVLAHLRKFGIFFAEPLDLDYTMLGTYAEAYTRLEPGERGPQASDPTGTVLGAAPTDAAFWSDESKVQRLRWYRYLFLNRSKPSTHLRALGRLDDDNLRAEAPEVLVALIEHVRARIGL
jgi:putative ATP-dependent endonuclease of OLD family